MPESNTTSSEERAEKYAAQTKDLYALLGEFAAEFELICFNMRMGIMQIMSMNGLKSPALARALCAELTAMPLLKAFHATALQTVDVNVKDKDALSLIYNRVVKLIEQRNDIIHGTWFIGWISEEQTDFSSAGGIKDKNAKSGTHTISQSIDAVGFGAKIAECKKVAQLVQRAAAAILLVQLGEKSSIAEQFAIVGKTIDIPPRV